MNQSAGLHVFRTGLATVLGLLLASIPVLPSRTQAASVPGICGTRDPLGSSALHALDPTVFSYPSAAEDHPIVDLLVVYTQPALDRCGGRAGLRTTVAGHVGFLNSAMAASGISARVRLVRIEPIPWSGQVLTIAQELGTLAESTEVSALRDECGADIVCEVGSGFTDHSGIARLGGAFSVVDIADCMVFAHEIAHNFGAMHDRPNTTSTAGFAYGYSFLVGRIRYGDIMSYAGLRIPLFSSPDRYWMGVRAGVPADQPLAADNARAMEAAAPAVAAWRPSRTATLNTPRRLSPDTFNFNLDVPDSLAGVWVVEYTSTESGSDWRVLDVFELPAGTTTITDDSVRDVPSRSYRARYASAYDTHAMSQVGFVRSTVPPGYSMRGICLDPSDTRIAKIWPNPPDGLTLFTFDSGRQTYAANVSDSGEWSQPGMRLQPGQGVILHNSGQETQFELVGESPAAFSLSLPADFSLACCPVPQVCAPTAGVAFPGGQDGDQVYRWQPDFGTYTVCVHDGGTWTPNDPEFGVGEGFWVRKLSWSQGSGNNLWNKVLWNHAP